jgi:predicted kinase
VTTLVIVRGLSFGGKSTLARAIGEPLGHREVDVGATVRWTWVPCAS